MEASVQVDTLEARLASWASATIGGSIVFSAIVVLLIVGVSNVTVSVGDHPVGALLVISVFAAYVSSLVCLRKIRRRANDSNGLLWGISLVATMVPILAVVSWLGLVAGLVICFLEVIAAIIHVVALTRA